MIKYCIEFRKENYSLYGDEYMLTLWKGCEKYAKLFDNLEDAKKYYDDIIPKYEVANITKDVTTTYCCLYQFNTDNLSDEELEELEEGHLIADMYVLMDILEQKNSPFEDSNDKKGFISQYPTYDDYLIKNENL